MTSHTITAVYAGNNSFTTSTSPAVSLNVGQANTATALRTFSANPSVFGQWVTFTATVTAAAPGSGNPSGTVTFMDGAATLGTGTLSNGVATLSYRKLITAVYSADNNYLTSTSNVFTQNV